MVIPVIPALRRLRQEDGEFQAHQGHLRPYHKAQENLSPNSFGHRRGSSRNELQLVNLTFQELENTQHKKGLAEWLKWASA
jgi:hypothetical protein